MQIRHGKNIVNVRPFTIQDIEYALRLRQEVSAAYPYAHFSKKGPGRKHQQGQALTKQERQNG